MATMNISLPEPLRDWVEAQSKSGLYANNSDYVRALIRQDRKLQEKQQRLQAAISAGFDSGDAGVLDIDAIKTKARQQQRSD